MSGERPWRRATAWLAFLGPFFFASYGFANWLASRRENVGAIIFDWEYSIPFVPWTILPYWSIDLLYVVSLFVCTSVRELDRHAQRLLVVQAISIFFFLVFPLKFAFGRPETDGAFGFLFTLLGGFDKPFNQAPSLHIGLLIVIWACLANHFPLRWRWLLHTWMVLIALSVLTTYQHHFIDLPTGAAVGLLVLWALPNDEVSPLRQLAVTTDGARRRLAVFYGVGAAVCGALACLGGTWLWFFWPAQALALVALNYAFFGERGFQKGKSGQLSAAARVLLAPYLVVAWLNSRLWTIRDPRPAEVIDGVSIGRVPGLNDRGTDRFSAIVDLSAEISCANSGVDSYYSIGVLDLTIPPAAALRYAATAIEEARQHGPVLVCCALGYSRSAAAVAAWLLMTRRAASVGDATDLVRRARPAVVLKSQHYAALEAFA